MDSLEEKFKLLDVAGNKLRKEVEEFYKVPYEKLKGREDWENFVERRMAYREAYSLVESEVTWIKISFSKIESKFVRLPKI